MASKDLDVRVKLGVESKEYREALRRANAEAKEFKKQQKAAAQGAGEGFNGVIAIAKKMAPAVSAGAAALSIAKKAMQENQSITDEWARITASATSTYEGFVNALVSGNLSSFFNNMDQIISKARQAADAIDALETAQLFNSREMARLGMEQEKHLSILRNKSITKEQRAESEAALREIFAQMDEESRSMSNYRFEAFAKRFADVMATQGTAVNWQDIIRRNEAGDYELTSDSKYQTYFDTLSNYEAAAARYNQMKEEREARRSELAKQGMGVLRISETLAKEFPEFKQLEAAIQVSDEKIREMFNQLIAAYNDRAQYYRNVGRANRYLNGTIGLNTDEREVALEGSIDALNKEIQQLTKQMQATADADERKLLFDEREKKKSELDKIQGELKAGPIQTLSPLLPQLTSAAPAMSGANSYFRVVEIQNAEEALTQSIADIAAGLAEANTPIKDFTLAIADGLRRIQNASSRGTNYTTYATGGIVGGVSYKGDSITAQVSSGEMILNRQQQRNLFNSLQGSESAPQASVVRIQGEDIYIALNNYQRRIGKR